MQLRFSEAAGMQIVVYPKLKRILFWFFFVIYINIRWIPWKISGESTLSLFGVLPIVFDGLFDYIFMKHTTLLDFYEGMSYIICFVFVYVIAAWLSAFLIAALVSSVLEIRKNR